MLKEVLGTWEVYYPRNNGRMTYIIAEPGVVTIGGRFVQARQLSIVPACSENDDIQDWNYNNFGTYYVRDAHRVGTWEYCWVEDDELRVHHFSTESGAKVSPFGSRFFFGVGHGTWQGWKAAKKPRVAPEVKQEAQAAPGDRIEASVVNCELSEFEGVWSMSYPRNNGKLTYSISTSGVVKVHGMDQQEVTRQLVQAGSEEDVKQDPNYSGAYFLDRAHRSGTWEYLWIANGDLHVHHFGNEFGESDSPFGSSFFFGVGKGTRKCAVAEMESMDDAEWASKLADFEGVWLVSYPRNNGKLTYSISKNGGVKLRGAKDMTRKLVPAGSVGDIKADRNYAGAFFLNNAHRIGTWEYIWIDNGKLMMHHFGDEPRLRGKLSPRGSSHFFGSGEGVKDDHADLEEVETADQTSEDGENGGSPRGGHSLKFVPSSAKGGSLSSSCGNVERHSPEAAEPTAQSAYGRELDVKELTGLYGVGASLLLGMGHSLGEGLGGREGAVPTCLHTSRKHSAGRGLGFGGSKGAPSFVTDLDVRPPLCTSCQQRRWPAWRSKEGRTHCGFCHKPHEGRPRCHACGSLTWDGWNAPKSGDCAWWCSPCWCVEMGADAEPWELWLTHRCKEFPEAFVDGGPEIFGKQSPPPSSSSPGEGSCTTEHLENEAEENEAAEVGEFEDFKGTWSIWYPRNNGRMVYSISASGLVTTGSKKKRRIQLVPAGSDLDVTRDPNYVDTCCYLNGAHRDGTWEYLWLEAGNLCVHHFATEHGEASISPFGSPYFFGLGRGTKSKTRS